MTDSRNLPTPEQVYLDLETGRIPRGAPRRAVYLSELREIFKDAKAFEDVLAAGDALVYEVLEIAHPQAEGEMNFGVSILYPGRVGEEYFMTRGHSHEKASTAEVYFCLKGTGCLLMQAEDETGFSMRMKPGTVAYVPPRYAHRTVNMGAEEFICFYAVPSDAGHNYAAISWDSVPFTECGG